MNQSRALALGKLVTNHRALLTPNTRAADL
jgi:hypothetical protein